MRRRKRIPRLRCLLRRRTHPRVLFFHAVEFIFRHFARTWRRPRRHSALQSGAGSLGHDTESGRLINTQVARSSPKADLPDRSYLGKEAGQNLMALRFGNALFEPLCAAGSSSTCRSRWRGLGVDAAAVSTIRRCPGDMCRTTAAAAVASWPGTAGQQRSDAVRDEKLKVLRAMRPPCGPGCAHQDVADSTRPARAARARPGYLDEADIAATASTETFAALK